MKVVTIYIPTDSEIMKAAKRNAEKEARKYNLYKAEKYLEYCKINLDMESIEYAERLLQKQKALLAEIN